MFKINYVQLPDEALMQRIAQRDERAFAALYDRYGARIYRYFYRMLWQDAGKAEDFAQDLFLKIIEKPHLYNPDHSFRTWIYAVALNMCKNEYRRKVPALQELDTAFPEPQEYFIPESLDRPLLEAALRTAIENLSESHRQCFVLRYQEELTVPEIAEIVGCPSGTVKSRLHHAVRQIADKVSFLQS
ncbi:MAG: sigma-70 family RNA polymerase sigma factor [Bacteroidota bacterium]